MNEISALRPAAFPVQKTGRAHQQCGEDCEDVVLIRETEHFCFYGLADGQSKKAHCAAGARRSLELVARYLEEKGVDALSAYPYEDEIQYELIRGIRSSIRELAEEAGASGEEFSSTLLALAFHPESGAYAAVHLGDGCLIGVPHEGAPAVLSPPDCGALPHQTWLTTSGGALTHLRLAFGDARRYRRFALLSDGADFVCSGRRLTREGLALLESGKRADFGEWWANAAPRDDASCLTVDLPKPEHFRDI